LAKSTSQTHSMSGAVKPVTTPQTPAGVRAPNCPIKRSLGVSPTSPLKAGASNLNSLSFSVVALGQPHEISGVNAPFVEYAFCALPPLPARYRERAGRNMLAYMKGSVSVVVESSKTLCQSAKENWANRRWKHQRKRRRSLPKNHRPQRTSPG